MAKLRDMVVNVIPKLDVRKATEMTRKLNKVVGKGFKAGKKMMKGVGMAGVMINQGMEMLKMIQDIINKPRGIIKEAMGMGDRISDLAETVGSTPARLIQLMKTFSAGGSGSTATMELLEKFVQRAEENGITGRLDDEFVRVLKEIGQEKDAAKRAAMVKQFFGARSMVKAKDAISAARDFEKNKMAMSSAIAYGKAAENAEIASSRNSDISFDANLERMLVGSQSGMFSAENKAQKYDEDAKMNVLKNSTSDGIVNAAKMFTNIQDKIEGSFMRIIDIITSIESKFGIFDKLYSAIEILTKVMSTLTFGFLKSDEEKERDRIEKEKKKEEERLRKEKERQEREDERRRRLEAKNCKKEDEGKTM